MQPSGKTCRNSNVKLRILESYQVIHSFYLILLDCITLRPVLFLQFADHVVTFHPDSGPISNPFGAIFSFVRMVPTNSLPCASFETPVSLMKRMNICQCSPWDSGFSANANKYDNRPRKTHRVSSLLIPLLGSCSYLLHFASISWLRWWVTKARDVILQFVVPQRSVKLW